MCPIYFIMATQPTEYVSPLLDMRENPDGINGLNLAEIKQMAFQQQDKRFENGDAAYFLLFFHSQRSILTF